jgi:uncharacterized membrane protein YhiD involved in acid resistance
VFVYLKGKKSMQWGMNVGALVAVGAALFIIIKRKKDKDKKDK